MDQYLLALSLLIRPATPATTQIVQKVIEVLLPSVEQTSTKTTYPELPAPIISVTQPSTYHRTDGYDNMCYRLNDSFTVVVIKDYDPNSLAMFPYGGTVDEYENASPFDQAVIWCKENDTQAF